MVKHIDWFEDKGDETYALDWPLHENSKVIEIGGFEGRWAQQIVDKFNPYLAIFEPQGWAYHRLLDRFGGNPKVTISNKGLWTHDAIMEIKDYGTDGASIVKTHSSGKNAEAIAEFIPVETIFSMFPAYDLALMNIEGGEFILLPYLIGTGLIQNFSHLFVQFHTFFDPQGTKWPRIMMQMENTHEMIWEDYPTAVAWRRK